jgi:cholest-5-ene-3beta,7alpha-diol 3beta-dehydrogenase
LVFLITGGEGFLGKAIVEELLIDRESEKLSEIRMLDIQHPQSDRKDQVTFIQGDIRDKALLADVCKGVDIVIHTAAVIDWGTKTEQEVLDINTGGTENLIHACLDNKVPYFIYTSSLDAIFNGKSMENIDESVAYPDKPVNAYCKSKQLAEELVRHANGKKLKTCILRPADIYGEGDPYHIGSLINMARDGFYVRLGNGKSVCQHVYVRNMAHAHLQVAKAFINKIRNVEGETYFITDGPAHNFFKFYEQVIAGVGYRIWPKNFWLPFWLAYTIGSIVEFTAWLINPIKKFHPKFSRFAVIYTCSNFTFNAEKAKRAFGYQPKYSVEEALHRTRKFYEDQRIF